VPLQDLLSEEASFRVITPESLVIKKIRKPGFFGLVYVLLQKVDADEIPHRYSKRVSLDEVGAHWPVHESLRCQGEILSFQAEVAWRLDGDELMGQTMLVLFPAVREFFPRQPEGPGKRMNEVERVPVGLRQEIDPVFPPLAER
jgi:hypothetical protein